MKIAILAAALAVACPGIAAAQTTAPVADANARVAAGVVARENAVGATNAEIRMQDMAAYDRALRQHHRAVNRDQRIYRRQQRAYADAMAVWRQQVRDCKHGSNRACRAPTPDPAAYF